MCTMPATSLPAFAFAWYGSAHPFGYWKKLAVHARKGHCKSEPYILPEPVREGRFQVIVVELHAEGDAAFFLLVVLQVRIPVVIAHHLQTRDISQTGACKHIADPVLVFGDATKADQ